MGEAAGGVECLFMVVVCLVELGMYRVLVAAQVLKVHRLDLVAETGAVGFLEMVVLQRNDELLTLEEQFLEFEGSVTVLPCIGLLVVSAVEHGEGEILLGGGHSHVC